VGRLFGYGSSSEKDKEKDKADSENLPSQFSDLKAANSDKDEQITVENEANKKSLWPIIKGLIGVDVTTTVSLPIWLFEDTTYLQRLAEMAEFDNFLDKASTWPNQWERILYVAVFCITGFHGTERFDKPFNPVIGETFEYVSERGVKFIAEQVSHKPPVGCCHFSNENFVCWQQGHLTVRFLGNSLDLDSTGSKGFVSFPKNEDVYSWTTPRATVHNCLVGKVWVDHHGMMPIKNHKTGDKVDLKWKKCGWFGSGRYEIEGDIVDAQGNLKIQIRAKWNEHITATWFFDGGEYPKGVPTCLWTKDPTQIGIHKVAPYCLKMNEMDEEYEKILPATDSRLRPDRRALQYEKNDKASVYKLQVEEKQRAQENARKARGEPWVPRWFKERKDEYYQGTIWTFTGEYWEQREKKIELLKTDPEAAQKLLVRDDCQGTACDFRSYTSLQD